MAERPTRPTNRSLTTPISRCIRRRSQRGAVMVEAALVLPLMVLLVLGILEFGLVFTSHSTTTASTRSGARIAATRYATATTAQTRETEADTIAAATAADLKVLNNGVPIGMAIYRVDPTSSGGAPVGGFPGTDLAGGCTQNCIRYTWDDAAGTMDYSSGSWVGPDACGLSVDSIGVYVLTRHHFITGMFGATHDVGAHTVMRLEPLPTHQCSGEIPG